MKTRDRFISVLIACMAIVACIVCVEFALPAQSYQSAEGKDYGYVYSGPKSASYDFTCASMPSDSILMFGSSELSTPPSLVPQVPANVFGTYEYGVNTTAIGEAYDQSLWHAIAAGAYAQHVENKKVVIIASPSWFVDDGIDSNVFQSRFSYNLYQEFCNNDAISSETKQLVAQRLAEHGISQSVVDAGLCANPISCIDNLFLSAIDDLKLRNELTSVREKGFAHKSASSQTPNFDELHKKAQADGAKACSSNTWNFDDASWNQSVEGHLPELRNSLADETFQNAGEYSEFDLLLTVCDQAGLTPLVIIPPLNGDYYDWVGVDSQTREACYNKIRSIAFSHRVSVADFSSEEYTPYFLHDQVHLAWIGWLDADEAIYRFVKGGVENR